MPVGLSKSQIDRLGLRLVEGDGQNYEDLDLLHQLLLERSMQLERAVARMRHELGVAPTSRMKNTETILEKLRRGDGSGLKSLQDLAGMRIVGDFDRAGQDDLVHRIVGLFRDGVRSPKVVDRRTEPMHGYRAVHVIVFPEGAPIEIQVRTRWQHEWAEFFEKLADRVGRGIRYGDRADQWDAVPDDGKQVRELLELRVDMSGGLVRWAHAVAGLIATVEIAEVATPDDPGTESTRRTIVRDLAEMHEALRGLDGIESSIARWRT